jgi:hypothetical protein
MSTSMPADEPINPYQPPIEMTPTTTRVVPLAESPAPVPLRFWEGRKALLQSLFYMRCFVVLTALITLREIYRLFSPPIETADADPFIRFMPLTPGWQRFFC